jgi:polyhydroxybutyrate depolymerase
MSVMKIETLMHQGLIRRFGWMSNESNDPGPTLILLHGAGGSAEWADLETRVSSHFLPRGWQLVFPEALPLHDHKPAKFLTNPRVWNDGTTWAQRTTQPADDDGFFRILLDRMVDEKRIDPTRIFLAGFSNGAGMAFRLARNESTRLQGLIVCGGHPRQEEVKPARPISTLYVLGEKDPLVPYEGGYISNPWGNRIRKPSWHESLTHWADVNELNWNPDDYDWTEHSKVWTSASASCRIEAHLVLGLGHHWPGGRGGMGERLGGVFREDPSLNDWIESFALRIP